MSFPQSAGGNPSLVKNGCTIKNFGHDEALVNIKKDRYGATNSDDTG
jgi:hypothetical protein